MTTTVAAEQTQIQIPARAAAIAWLNAFLAVSQDEERPALYRTLSLEFFNDGVHLIGCDGTVLFRSWVASDGVARWPFEFAQGKGEAHLEPNRSVVVMDPDGFGIGFMRALLRVTGEEEHANEELTITTAEADEEANLLLGAEFMSERVILRACGQRIDLRLFEADYPNWRVLNLGIDAQERVEGLTLAPRMFGLVGKLKGVNATDLEFFGETKHIGFTARGESEVRGLLMPMRRPEKTKEPQKEPPVEQLDTAGA